MYLTYCHKTLDGKVFYVGCGNAKRPWNKKDRTEEWKAVAANGYTVEIASQFEVRDEAWEHEKHLIANFRSLGHPLTNKANGGAGTLGVPIPEETRAKISAIKTGKPISEDHRLKIATKKHLIFTNESREKMSALKQGENNPMFGRKHKPETLAIYSEQRRGRTISVETRAKISASLKLRAKKLSGVSDE